MQRKLLSWLVPSLDYILLIPELPRLGLGVSRLDLSKALPR